MKKLLIGKEFLGMDKKKPFSGIKQTIIKKKKWRKISHKSIIYPTVYVFKLNKD